MSIEDLSRRVSDVAQGHGLWGKAELVCSAFRVHVHDGKTFTTIERLYPLLTKQTAPTNREDDIVSDIDRLCHQFLAMLEVVPA